MVIWIAGLSGAGKSTVCDALYERLKPSLPHLVLLDGDAVREAFGNDLAYTEADRRRQVSRVQRLARLLSSQGLIVIVALVYSHPELMEWNRANIPDYFEVLVDAPVDFVTERDSKRLYSRARRGETRDVVGVDIEWHRPSRADLVLDATKNMPPLELAETIATAIPILDSHWRTAAIGR
jgi:cytidine diphosphoramidate kinase